MRYGHRKSELHLIATSDDPVETARLVASDSALELDTFLARPESDGWIHDVRSTNETTATVVEPARTHRDKVSVLLSPDSLQLKRWMAHLSEEDTRLFVCLERAEQLADQLRDPLLSRPPHSYTYAMLRRMLPRLKEDDPDFTRFVLAIFVEQELSFTIAALLGHSKSTQHRVWEAARRHNIASLIRARSAVYCVRAAHFMIERGLDADVAARTCGESSARTLERHLATVLDVRQRGDLTALGMEGVVERAGRFMMLDPTLLPDGAWADCVREHHARVAKRERERERDR
jgi:hypothetical protein